MIQFKEGQPFEFLVSSGALGFDGRGWWWEHPLRWLGLIDPKAFVVVAKTVTDQPRKGNLRMYSPWTCVRTLPGLGATNAVGLTNPGIDHWISDYLPVAQDKGYNIAPSIKPENPDEAERMALLLSKLAFPFVEINVSCPNVAEHVPDDIPEILRRVGMSKNRMVLKLSLDQVNQRFIEAVDPYVDAYHAINTIPWDVIFPGRTSPIQKYSHGLKGGVSGPMIKPHALTAVTAIHQISDKPVIGGGGIFSLQDVCQFRDAGAAAFSFGSVFLHRPWRPNRIVRQYRRKFHLPKSA